MIIPTSVVSILNKYYYINDNKILLNKYNSEYKNDIITVDDLINFKDNYNKTKTIINIQYYKRN